MIGIISYGVYLPRYRMDRSKIVEQMGWFAPALIMAAQGQRSVCNWDEDSLTMAVAAARQCVRGLSKQALDGVFLATTTPPFADRQNSGIVATALNLKPELTTADFSGSLKAGTTALLAAISAIRSGEHQSTLVVGSDHRQTKAGSFQELWFGDGAAALWIGQGDQVIACFEGSHSVAGDFVDHYRGAHKSYDYWWEERWARDMGFGQIIPRTVSGLLAKLNLAPSDVAKVVFPCMFRAFHGKLAATMGFTPEQTADSLYDICGDTGTGHPLLMLTAVLDQASPGDRIIMAGFGQGCDALCFQVTEAIQKLDSNDRFSSVARQAVPMTNYIKWLSFRNLIRIEKGIRAEAPTQTAMTTLWRNREMILGLVGGKCSACGTIQFPKTDVCVNPKCGASQSQQDYEFADEPAFIKSFTADRLAVTPDPPATYGMIQFKNGGRFMADFTDCQWDTLKVGQPVEMEFRRRGADPERGFVNYFWKAVPKSKETLAAMGLRFHDQVAVVTGAGAGLGRIYALELARRGAKVVVNDLGGTRDGSGEGSRRPADRVVEEIRAMGGEAVANYDNVATAEGGQRIVQSALDAFGRLDILINNAGILRDKSFAKMSPDQWLPVLDVHVHGAFYVTQPAFRIMKQQGYGRIVFTTSAAGLYGNFGQTNYSAAKMALVGLMNTLKQEGRTANILVNTVAPMAASRLTEDIMPPELFEKMDPMYVAPLVLYLCSDQCQKTGMIFNAGMGYFSRAAIVTGPGIRLGDAQHPPTVEMIHDHWEQINSLEGHLEIPDATTGVGHLMNPPEVDAATTEPGPSQSAEEITSVAAIFEAMPAAFDPDAAQGVDVVFQYHISGPTGGDWVVMVKDGTCQIIQGTDDKPTCTLKISDTDFIRMVSGELNPMHAFTSGKLVIEGDVMKSQLIEKLFKI